MLISCHLMILSMGTMVTIVETSTSLMYRFEQSTLFQCLFFTFLRRMCRSPVSRSPT